jgi:DNA-binding transcriptional ArsR family regulator
MSYRNAFSTVINNATLQQRALAHAEAEREVIIRPLEFYHEVSPSKGVREASNEVDSLLREYKVDRSARLDLFKAKQAAKGNIEKAGKKLDLEEQHLVDKMMQDDIRAGLALPEETREEVMRLKKELSSACVEIGVSFSTFRGNRAYQLNSVLRKIETRRMCETFLPSSTAYSHLRIFRKSYLLLQKSSGVCPKMLSPNTLNVMRARRSFTTLGYNLITYFLLCALRLLFVFVQGTNSTFSLATRKLLRHANAHSKLTSLVSESIFPYSIKL